MFFFLKHTQEKLENPKNLITIKQNNQYNKINSLKNQSKQTKQQQNHAGFRGKFTKLQRKVSVSSTNCFRK